MATKKKSRTRSGVINHGCGVGPLKSRKVHKIPSLAELRSLAKQVCGEDAEIVEQPFQVYVRVTAPFEPVMVSHENIATARRMLKAALEAAL